jgi:hypothetical protein
MGRDALAVDPIWMPTIWRGRGSSLSYRVGTNSVTPTTFFFAMKREKPCIYRIASRRLHAFADGIAVALAQRWSEATTVNFDFTPRTGAEMELRKRKLSESRSAFPAPRNICKKRESNPYCDPARFPASNVHADWPTRNASVVSDIQYDGRDHTEMRFTEEEGLVLFDRSAEHHLYVPFLNMLLRRYRDKPESRASVREWVSARNSSYPLGFDSLCDYIDLDADYVRGGVTRWLNQVDRGLEGNRRHQAAANPATN